MQGGELQLRGGVRLEEEGIRYCSTRGPVVFVQARKCGNAGAHLSAFAQSVIGVSGRCESLHDRRRGLPTDSGRQAASPSPTRDLTQMLAAAGRAWCEWCSPRRELHAAQV
jgi:hypothetical protein